MKIKFGDMTVRQVKKICDKTYPSCGNCQLAPNGACLLACSLSDKAISMEYETDLPDELAKSTSISSTEAVRSLGEYALCDQWVCPKCGIELQDYVEIERDEDDGEEVRHEYCPKFCPECGRRIIDPDEEVKEDAVH